MEITANGYIECSAVTSSGIKATLDAAAKAALSTVRPKWKPACKLI